MKMLKAATIVARLTPNVVLAYWLVWRQPPQPQPPPLQNRGMVVLRTPGGLLEVSTINSEERFESTVQHTILGVPVGKTVALIRVPAV